MEKLNELVAALYPQYGTPGSRDIDVTERRKVVVESAAAIAEAFRALERTSDTNMAAAQAMRDDMYHWKQRAEAAEAKLTEKGAPVAMRVRYHPSPCCAGSWVYADIDKFKADTSGRYQEQELFTRPAPAADLMPGEWTNEQCLEFLSIAFRHAEISGDIEMDDIRLAVKMVNAAAPEVE